MEDWQSASTLASLQSELADLEKAPTFDEWELLNTAYSALILNFNELAAHLNLPNRDFSIALKLLEFDLTSEFYRNFHLEILRRLLNFCATVSTLVDHTRSFMEGYQRVEQPLYDAYQVRLKHVIGLDVAMFVQGLRNYMLHYRLPSTGHQMSFSNYPESLSHHITLSSEKLREWSRWKPQAMSYLEARENIILLQAVEEYTRAVVELYKSDRQ